MKLRRGPLASLRVSRALANRKARRSGARRGQWYRADRAAAPECKGRPNSHILAWATRRPRAARLLTVWDAALNTARGEPVAQLVEHLTFNQVVQGSSPCGLTTISPN